MNPSPFTPVQQSVLDAISLGATKSAAARAANIHRDTIHHWERTIDGFCQALLNAKSTYREGLESQLRRIAAKSLDRLESLLNDPITPPAVLFRAIQFSLTRPSFPQKEWSLPENLNPPEIQQMQRSMAIIEADYLSASQHDAVRQKAAQSAGNAGSTAMQTLHEGHFPPSIHVPLDIPCSVPDPLQPPETSDLSESSDLPVSSELPERYESSESSEPSESPARKSNRFSRRQPARNAACPCGSGKKYKRCCGVEAPPLLIQRNAA